MLVVFSSIFVADTKIISCHDFVAPLKQVLSLFRHRSILHFEHNVEPVILHTQAPRYKGGGGWGGGFSPPPNIFSNKKIKIGQF